MTTSLGIAAAGMVTSLGYDMQTACAAARAGIVRPSPVDYQIKASDESAEMASGHSVVPLTDGFGGDARLIRLLGQALRDLFLHPGAAAMRDRVGWYLALPTPARRATATERVDPELRKLWIDELAYEPDLQPDDARAQRILHAALDVAGATVELPSHVEISTAGHTSVTELVARALEHRATGRFEVAVVAAVDSLVDSRTLEWLSMTQRLKSGEAATGLCPGEAAGVLLLTKSVASRSAHLPSLGSLHNVQSATTARPFLGQQPPNGDALAAVLHPITARQSLNGCAPWLVVDQNGETYRASDWSHALVKLRARSEAYANPTLWYPVMSFGDTGAASGVVAICSVLQAFKRNYAPSDIASVVNCSDDAQRTALLVEKG